MGRSLTAVSYWLSKEESNIKSALRSIESENSAPGAWKVFIKSVLSSSETRTNIFQSGQGKKKLDPYEER